MDPNKVSFWPRLFFALLIGLAIGQSCQASEDQDRRVRIGLRLFRSLLAADLDLADKVDKQGKLSLLLVFTNNRKAAATAAQALAQSGRGKKKGTLLGLPLRVEVSKQIQADHFQRFSPAGIFLLQPLSTTQLKTVIAYGITHHIVVFSPFKGSVSKGVSAGVVIEARVRPYINLNILQQSKIRIKPFFRKVAKHYE